MRFSEETWSDGDRRSGRLDRRRCRYRVDTVYARPPTGVPVIPYRLRLWIVVLAETFVLGVCLIWMPTYASEERYGWLLYLAVITVVCIRMLTRDVWELKHGS